jgi:hypothetical protein
MERWNVQGNKRADQSWKIDETEGSPHRTGRQARGKGMGAPAGLHLQYISSALVSRALYVDAEFVESFKVDSVS